MPDRQDLPDRYEWHYWIRKDWEKGERTEISSSLRGGGGRKLLNEVAAGRCSQLLQLE